MPLLELEDDVEESRVVRLGEKTFDNGCYALQVGVSDRINQ